MNACTYPRFDLIVRRYCSTSPALYQDWHFDKKADMPFGYASTSREIASGLPISHRRPTTLCSPVVPATCSGVCWKSLCSWEEQALAEQDRAVANRRERVFSNELLQKSCQCKKRGAICSVPVR